MVTDQDYKARLRWQCRRGMLELDLILLPFLNAEFDAMPSTQQKDFALLLECTDPELFAWFIGHVTPPDPILAALVEKISHHAQRNFQT